MIYRENYHMYCVNTFNMYTSLVRDVSVFLLQSFECNVDDLENDGDYAELGRGQYGSVYRMRHKPTNTIMAVKVYRYM